MSLKRNVIVDKSFEFSLSVIDLYRQLVDQKEYVLSKQLLRSATSIGVNVEEAQAAQSKKDFIAKMSISSKEARESLYWIRLLDASQIIRFDYSQLRSQIDEIIKILTAIVKSAQKETSKN